MREMISKEEYLRKRELADHKAWNDYSIIVNDKNDNLVDNVNGVTKDNTVNENLTALNNTIGDITGLNAYEVDSSTGNALATRDAAGNVIKTQPTTVVEALNNIDATLVYVLKKIFCFF